MRQRERAPEQVRMLDGVGHIPTRRLRAAAGGLDDFSRVVVDHVPMLHLVAAACRVPRKHGARTAAQICLERPHPPRAVGTLLRRTLCLVPVPRSVVVACRGCLSLGRCFIRRFPLTIVLFHNTDLLFYFVYYTLFTHMSNHLIEINPVVRQVQKRETNSFFEKRTLRLQCSLDPSTQVAGAKF
jgi:hypothetical protein